MKVTNQTLHQIAQLARLEIHPDKEEKLLNDLNQILDWVATLQEVDTAQVEPLIHLSEEINLMREDAVGEHLSNNQALQNAPEPNVPFFAVPKVLD